MNRPNTWTTLANWDWLLYLLLLPIVVAAVDTWGWLLLLIPLSLVLQWLGHGRPWPRTPLNLPIIVLGMMGVVGYWVSFDQSLSWPKVAGLLFGLAVAWRTVSFIQRWQQGFSWAIALFLAFGWAIVALSLLGAAWPRTIPIIGQSLSLLPAGALTLAGGDANGYNPNEIAGVMLWVTPFACALAWGWLAGPLRRERVNGRWTTLAGMFVVVTALVFTAVLSLTFSRGGVLALVIGLVALIIFAGGRWRQQVLVLTALVFITLLILIGRNGLEDSLAFVIGGNSEFSMSGGIASLAGRTEIWSRALYGIADFPMTGMGMGTFRELVHILYPLFLISSETDISHAHNHWLQAGLDVGIPGLIAYISIWLGAIGLLMLTGRTPRTALHRWAGYGLAASFTAYFVFGLVDTVALGARPGFVFWYMIGLAVGLHDAVRSSAP